MEPPVLRAWRAWVLVFRTLERIAPEVLEELAQGVPPYPPAFGQGVYQWGDLAGMREDSEPPGTAFVHGLLLKGQDAEAVRGFREALLAWGQRHNLAHPLALDLAVQVKRGWALGIPSPNLPPILSSLPYKVDAQLAPSLPNWEPARESWQDYLSEVKKSLNAYKKRVVEQEKPTWTIRHPKEGAILFVLHRVKNWPLRSLRERARAEGLVEKGRVIVPKLSPTALWERLQRFEKLLGIAIPEESVIASSE